MTDIRWLHLSDFHQGQPHAGAYDWRAIREFFFRDLAWIHDQSGDWDLVLFTGDVAFSGRADEYSQASRVLDDLLGEIERLQGYAPVLLAVPGNHDLHRPSTIDAQAVRDQLVNDAESFWSDSTLPARQIIDTAFSAFSSWQKTQPGTRGFLPGEFSYVHQRDGRRLGIIGLNSAFRHLADVDVKGQLHLHVHQLYGACGTTPEQWLDSCDAILLLTHHPPEWLDPESIHEYGQHIQGRVSLHLFGHMHEPRFLNMSRGGTPHTTWQSPALYGMEKHGAPPAYQRLHGYSAGQLTFDERGAHLRIWPREATRNPDGWHLHPPTSVTLSPDGATAEVPVTVTRRTRQAPSVIRRLIGERKLRRNDAQHVETSAHEFLLAAEAILYSLRAGDEVYATDHLRPAVRQPFWCTPEGLQYLELNHTAAGNGVRIHRYFLVSGDDLIRGAHRVNALLRLHRRAGVHSYLVRTDDLRPESCVEFAVFGPHLVDLPQHNAQGEIVHNIISWNPGDHTEVQLKLLDVRKNAQPHSPMLQRWPEFQRVRKLARDILGARARGK